MRKKSELPPPEVLSQLKLYDLPEVQADFVEVGVGDEREAVLMLGRHYLRRVRVAD